jgi:hypothetical protein
MPGEACDDCGRILHGFPCIHHEDDCPHLVAEPRTARVLRIEHILDHASVEGWTRRRTATAIEAEAASPAALRDAALGVVREWNAGGRIGKQLTPMWTEMESLVLALASAEAASPAALDVDALRLDIIEVLHRFECDEEPLPHDWKEHLPADEPAFHPNRIDGLVNLFHARLTEQEDRHA